MISEANISRVFTSFRSALISRPMPGARWYLAIRSMASDIRPTKPSDGLRAASRPRIGVADSISDIPDALSQFSSVALSRHYGAN
jgi:hypothetical protein